MGLGDIKVAGGFERYFVKVLKRLK